MTTATAAPRPLAGQAWITVRCPCRRNTLGEVRGTGGEVRRYCHRCKGWWIIDVATGKVRGAPLA